MATQKWPAVATIWQEWNFGDVDWGSNEETFQGSFHNELEIEIIYRCKHPYGTWSVFTVEIHTKNGDNWDLQYVDRVFFDIPPDDESWKEEVRTYKLLAPSNFKVGEVELEFAITARIFVATVHNPIQRGKRFKAIFTRAPIAVYFEHLEMLELNFQNWLKSRRKELKAYKPLKERE